MDLTITRAGPADAATLQNLIQLYTHDFADLWSGAGVRTLGPDGRFPDYPLAPYFERAGWQAWLFLADGTPAGFALVNDEAHSGLPVDRSMAELFVIRPHRRSGLGQGAAERLLRASPGQWEAAVTRRNAAALAFWRRVAEACALPGTLQELDLDGPGWTGPVIRFRT